MKKLTRIIPLFGLVAALAVAGIAATPAVLAQPEAPSIQATQNGGELVISWNRIPGAKYYTLGWINWTEGQPVSASGGDWLSLFHYTTVAGDRTSYTVKGLNGGDNHYAIIRVTDAAGTSGRFGGGYSAWSAWSSSFAQPAAQHGEGFCPITGLPMPAGGYLGIGDIQNWDGYEFGVTGVESPQTVTGTRSDGTKYERPLPAGRSWLRIYLHLDNQANFTINLDDDDHVLVTDRGIAMGRSGDRELESGERYESGTSVLYDIPEDATTAVLAIRPFINRSEDDPVLFRFPIPERSAATVVFGDLNWESALIQTRIAQYMVEKGYGYSTDTRFGATLPLFQSLRGGEVQVLMELWLPNQQAAWTAATAAGEVVSLGGSLGRDWQSAFVIPAYLLEQYPALDSVQDLKDPQFQRLFATPQTGGKARLVSCVIGWACETVNAAQVEAYGLSDHVHIVNPGDGAALNADLYSAYERREPWLGYQWGTNDPALLLDLVRLQEPAYSGACWSTTKACAYADAIILIAANPKLRDTAPEVAEMLRKWDFAVDPVYKGIVRWRAENQSADVNATALWWLNNRANTWEPWVTQEAAASIRAALAANEIPDGWPDT